MQLIAHIPRGISSRLTAQLWCMNWKPALPLLALLLMLIFTELYYLPQWLLEFKSSAQLQAVYRNSSYLLLFQPSNVMQYTKIVLYCQSMLASQLSLNPLLPYSPPHFWTCCCFSTEAEKVFTEIQLTWSSSGFDFVTRAYWRIHSFFEGLSAYCETHTVILLLNSKKLAQKKGKSKIRLKSNSFMLVAGCHSRIIFVLGTTS